MFQSLGAKTFILPTPVFLVGTYDHTGRPNIMTAAWGGICASQPPSIAVSIRKSRWTYNAILERKSFTIEFLPANSPRNPISPGCIPGAIPTSSRP